MFNLDRNGYALADLVLAASACERIAEALPDVERGRGGVRNVLALPVVAELLNDPRFLAGPEPGLVAVKATLFDKTSLANWRVAWHQDRIIAVEQRVDAEGYTNWTTKRGVAHAEPPTTVLEQMLAARIHLDDCGPDNGPLRLIPTSHRLGKLTDEALAELVATSDHVAIAVPRGAILFMRPLLVHASSPAVTASHRRVLHIEFAPQL